MNCFLDLKNNALFLSCWYERSRPVHIICFGVLILSIIFVSFLNVSAHETKMIDIWRSLFYVIVGVQATVILLQATMFASHMGTRERTSETLDFHRNSPQPVESKVIGIIFGSTWFEWAIFCVLFIVELSFALLPDIDISKILLFNASLMLSGIFFHTVAVMISLLSTQRKKGISFFGLLLLVWFGAPVVLFLAAGSSSQLFSHLLGITAIQYVFPEQSAHFNGRFYILNFSLIVMQAMIQIPLFLLMVNGIKRVFCRPNSPAWSKINVIWFCGFLLFMVTGFFVADYIHMDDVLSRVSMFRMHQQDPREFFKQEAYLLSFLFLMMGTIASFFCAPTYFKRTKHLVLSKKGLINHQAIMDDGASSLPAIFIFVCMGAVFMIPYLMAIKCSIYNGLYYFLLLTSYIVAFTGFLEFFRLGRFRNNKVFLVTVILVWWVFIPWTVSALGNFGVFDQMSISSISPLFGLGYAVSSLTGEKSGGVITLIAPYIVAGIMWILAYQENSLVEKNARPS